MSAPVKIGERVAWPWGGGERSGTVEGIDDRGRHQLLAVAAADGRRHALIVAPGARGGIELLATLSSHDDAVALARTILAGTEPRMPLGVQVLTLAAALAAPACLPKPKEDTSDERSG